MINTQTEQKQHPMLFSTPMVQAILEGRKTQTRRIVTQTNSTVSPRDKKLSDFDLNLFARENNMALVYWPDEETRYRIFCKKQPGDIIWVRETWGVRPASANIGEMFFYKASAHHVAQSAPIWKPSIHMPKRACRIFLEITDISVERLQDISATDAKAEGINFREMMLFGLNAQQITDSYRLNFKMLWQTINGEQSWNSNPFVWKTSFKPINK